MSNISAERLARWKLESDNYCYDGKPKLWQEGFDKGFKEGSDASRKLIADNESKQAKIDALMLEYCPENMTKKQVTEYESRQKAVDYAESAQKSA